MCRRLFQNLPLEDMRQWLRTTNAVPNAQPPYNAAPTQDLAVGRYNPETGERSLTCSAGAHSSLGAGLVDRHRPIGSAHVCTPVTHAHLGCSLQGDKKQAHTY